jgi:surface protein
LAGKFNGDISTWNVSQCQHMSEMFAGAGSFQGDLSNWNTPNLLDMEKIFWQAPSFNSDLPWDVSRVQNMSMV